MSNNLLRIFNTQEEYKYKRCLLEKGSISLVDENNKVNYGIVPSNFIAIYNITNTSSKTRILGFDSTNIKQVSKMYIDDVEVTPTSAYTFTTLGKHKVKCTFDCDALTNANSMFMGCGNLTSLDLSGLDTSNVTDMYRMFYNCSGLTSLDLSGLDTSKVTTMSEMFKYCYALTSLDLTPLNTSNVTNMSYMFQSCSDLTYINLTSLDTHNVTDMMCMFNYCSSLTSLDLTPLNTSNVTNMRSMFSSCDKLSSLDVSNLDTSNVTNMLFMFEGCYALTSLTMLGDISKVTLYTDMFRTIAANGTLTYNCVYEDAWNNILVTNQSTSKFPSTWTKTCV